MEISGSQITGPDNQAHIKEKPSQIILNISVKEMYKSRPWSRINIRLSANITIDNLKNQVLRKLGRPETTWGKYNLEIAYRGINLPLLNMNVFYMVLRNAASHSQMVQLTINKQNEDLTVIEYDIQGKLLKTRVLEHRPNYKIYPHHSAERFCVFCKESSTNLDLLKKAGPIYGPIKIRRKNYFMHELCAIWIPDIYFSKKKGIKAANRNMCSLCGELGAGLGCSHIDENGSFCKRHYHYRCMLNDRATPDWTTYKILCKDHIICEENYLDSNSDQNYFDNLICSECMSGLDEAQMLICERCQKGFHTYCHFPKIKEIPEDNWYCAECIFKNSNDNIENVTNILNEFAI